MVFQHTVKPGSFLWNATLSPHLDSSRVQEQSSDIDMHGLEVFLEQFYNPPIPIETEELDNDSDQELENIMAEMMALLSTLQDVDASDSNS